MVAGQRELSLQLLENEDFCWDIVVIGGGATGLGTALDAASRGFKTLLLEQSDFAKATSSRSTKLAHGGVRYLEQGDIGMVIEALKERGIMQKNAPHLVQNQSFIIPNYKFWEGTYYYIGLKLYELLAGKLSFGKSSLISENQVIRKIPTINSTNLYGGIEYYDGQFDDARLAINLAQTAIEQGAHLLNYAKVIDLIKNEKGELSGVEASDVETGKRYRIKTKVIVNATGVFADDLLQKDEKGKKPMIMSSQGTHLVIDKSFLLSEEALMVPKTSDGRVLFAVPWHGKVLVGTTDTALNDHQLEPIPLEKEIDFILTTIAKYLTKIPTRADILSVFAGLRPLAAPQSGATKTKEISRSHKILVSKSGLITIIGGKWTTYRKMSEDTVNKAIEVGKLAKNPCITEDLPIHGNYSNVVFYQHLSLYGSDKKELLKLMLENKAWHQKIHPELPYFIVEIIWAVRHEMARTVDDVLARRVRILHTDARKAIEIAPKVADIMAKELGKTEEWASEQVKIFKELAKNYLPKEV